MTRECQLCGNEALEAGDVSRRLLEEFWPEGGTPDFVGLKRALEADLDVELTVWSVKRHALEHVRFRWSGGAEEGLA